jgi:hypothetical protein
MRTALSLTILLPLVACGGDKTAEQAPASEQAAASETSFDPCALLSSEEIMGTLGWSPDSSQKKTYGTTGNCTYFGPNAMLQQISLLVGQGMPDMSDSRKMADWRARQYTDYKVTDAIVEPVEGLGVPAIRNEYGVVAIEMAVGAQLVTVGSIAANFEQVRKLAGFVLARMK